MKDKIVKDLMVPLTDYPTIDEKATLYDAILALENVQKKFEHRKYRHRAILILGKDNQVVGKLGLWDVLQALEPKYQQIEDLEKMSRTGFSPQFLKSMLDEHALWNKPLVDACTAGAARTIKDLMYIPTKTELIKEDVSLGEAIHQLVVGRYLSLLVVDNAEKVIGILRLIDIFEEIMETMKACKI